MKHTTTTIFLLLFATSVIALTPQIGTEQLGSLHPYGYEYYLTKNPEGITITGPHHAQTFMNDALVACPWEYTHCLWVKNNSITGYDREGPSQTYTFDTFTPTSASVNITGMGNLTYHYDQHRYSLNGVYSKAEDLNTRTAVFIPESYPVGTHFYLLTRGQNQVIMEKYVANVIFTTNFVPETGTSLVTDMTVSGSWERPGSIFTVSVSVTNTGVETAEGVRTQLQNIPVSWFLLPGNNQAWVGDVQPGQTKTQTYFVQRSHEEASIHAAVLSGNAPLSTSASVLIENGQMDAFYPPVVKLVKTEK